MACLFKINITQRSIEPWNTSIKWLLANATKGHKILSGKEMREMVWHIPVVSPVYVTAAASAATQG